MLLESVYNDRLDYKLVSAVQHSHNGRFLVHVRTISIGTPTHLTGLFGKEYSRLRTLFLKRYMPP